MWQRDLLQPIRSSSLVVWFLKATEIRPVIKLLQLAYNSCTHRMPPGIEHCQGPGTAQHKMAFSAPCSVGSIRCAAPAAAVPPPVPPSSVQVRASPHVWRERIEQSAKVAVLLPLAACTIFSSWVDPVEAGLLSGIPGLGPLELPSLPSPPDVVKQIQEGNRKRYEDLDAKFKSSPFLQDLLKKSKENAELHRKEIQAKYCERGAEWGVGDCSLAGLSQAEKDAFYEALKRGK